MRKYRQNKGLWMDWALVDWADGDTVISRKFKVSRNVVQKYRIRNGKPKCTRRLIGPRIDPETLPWNLPLAALAKQSGYSVNHLRIWRKRLGRPLVKDRKGRPPNRPTDKWNMLNEYGIHNGRG